MSSRTTKLNIVVASFAAISFAASAHADLVHRYSFNETGGAGTTLVDSVGTADGTIADPGGGADGSAAGGGQVTLTGGAMGTADYIDLPTNLISGFTDITIETWATQNNTGNWSRIFDFGSSESDYLMMAWTKGTTITTDRAEIDNGTTAFTDDTQAPYTLGQEFHIVMTVDADGGTAGNALISVYKDGVAGGTIDTNKYLTDLTFTNMWIGRSQFLNDATADASYNEFRIYDMVLSGAEVATSFAAGPDASFGSPVVPEPSTFILFGLGLLALSPVARARRARRRTNV